MEDMGGFDFSVFGWLFPGESQNLKIWTVPFIELLGDTKNPRICSWIKFCQIYVIMWGFAKFVELCKVLPKIWKYVKFCQKDKISCYFCQIYGVMPSFVKNMELCEVLPKIWSYAKFCQKYGVMF